MIHETHLSLDKETHGSHLLMASELHKELLLREKPRVYVPKLYGQKTVAKKGKKAREEAELDEMMSGAFSISESQLSENFYHKVDVVETGLTMIPLEKFGARVLEIRQLFPENLVLAQISKVIERIIGFPLRSPISKILAGLDLLLVKAQAWEAVSPKMYSLDGMFN